MTSDPENTLTEAEASEAEAAILIDQIGRERAKLYSEIKERHVRFQDVKMAMVSHLSLLATDDEGSVIPFLLSDIMIKNREGDYLFNYLVDSADLIYLTRRFTQSLVSLKKIVEKSGMTDKIGQLEFLNEKISEIVSILAANAVKLEDRS